MSVYKLKGTSGAVINRSFPLPGTVLLGSASECDIRIDETGVAARHAQIRLMDDGNLLLKDLGSQTGTLLNGEQVEESQLSSGDEIRIGRCRWMLQAPGLKPARVLTGDAVTERPAVWPRLLLWTGLLAATAAVAVLKWKPEWLGLF